LPVQDDPDYRRYFGFVGLDDHLSEAIYQIAALYSHLGGAPVVPPGQEGGFTQLILDQTTAKIELARAEEEEKRKRGE
jgi:hypothetical protein